MSEQQQQQQQQAFEQEEVMKRVALVEKWSQPELQAFHLHSPPRPSSHPKGDDLLVAEVVERVGGSVASAHEMGAAIAKAEEQPPPHPTAAPTSSGNDVQEDKKPESPAQTVGLVELFRFADGLDCALMAVGTVGAIVHGCSLPIFLRFFADLVNSFGSNTGDPSTMAREVTKYAFYFLVVGAAIWVSSWAEISCWMWTGERQSTKMRIKYLEAALNQDVRYFDAGVRTSDVIFAINADAVMVQDAISEKVRRG